MNVFIQWQGLLDTSLADVKRRKKEQITDWIVHDRRYQLLYVILKKTKRLLVKKRALGLRICGFFVGLKDLFEYIYGVTDVRKKFFRNCSVRQYKGWTYGCHPEVREANNEGSARDCSKEQHDTQRKDPSQSLCDVQDDSAIVFFKQTDKLLTGFLPRVNRYIFLIVIAVPIKSWNGPIKCGRTYIEMGWSQWSRVSFAAICGHDIRSYGFWIVSFLFSRLEFKLLLADQIFPAYDWNSRGIATAGRKPLPRRFAVRRGFRSAVIDFLPRSNGAERPPRCVRW